MNKYLLKRYFNKYRIILVICIAMTWFNGYLGAIKNVLADEEIYPDSWAPRECFRNISICTFYPKIYKPHIYEKSDSTTEFSDSRSMTDYERRPPHYLNDWIADPNDLKANKKLLRIYHLWTSGVAWINRDDIITFSELHKVKRCWPVPNMIISNGDADSGDIKLGADGTGYIENGNAVVKKTVVSAWFSHGVFSIRLNPSPKSATRRDQFEVAWGNLDYKNRTITHRANWIISIPSDQEILKLSVNCDGGPNTGLQ